MNNKMMKRCFAVLLSFALITLSVERSFAMLIPTQTAVDNASVQRTADLQSVQTFLEQQQVRKQLAHFGMSENEIQTRLNNLSDDELHHVATHIDKEHAAADGGGFVITILLIGILALLFVYLLKRV